jgi:cytochrome b6-f complex iron-sulfur subunit
MYTLDVEQQQNGGTREVSGSTAERRSFGLAFAGGFAFVALAVVALFQVTTYVRSSGKTVQNEEGLNHMVQGFSSGLAPVQTSYQKGVAVPAPAIGSQKGLTNDPEAAGVENLQTMKSVLDSLHFTDDFSADKGISEVLASLQKRFEKNPNAIALIPMIPAEKMNVVPKKELGSPGSRSQVVMSASTAPVPDMQRRTIMNLLVLGVGAVPVGWMLGGYIYFFIPPDAGGGGGGLVAKDAAGTEVTFDGWLSSHQAEDRSLVEGLKGDAHYLIVTPEGKIEDYAINAVCTHLGCVVPWNRAQNKYMCPCHGSQYDNTGKVVRGPAPLSLALAHVDNADGKVLLRPWKETDFRTGNAPWWK